jgi:hypothetical protein
LWDGAGVGEPADASSTTIPLWGMALLVVMIGITWWASLPPSAILDRDVDARVFSAGRALSTIRRLDPAGEPQPVGSAAHAAVRERLVEELRALGLAVDVQAAWSCRAGAVCAPTHNVVARVEGRHQGPAVMLSAHYDTVHAAPGAGDDMHGIAVLIEVARALTAEAPPRNPVVLLATDAEEQGLLGARAFVEHHEMASDIAVVVNVDARGTRGRSNMFETSPGNGPLMALFAAAVGRPSASSLAYEVYRRMPNDTDFTIFRHAGMKGFNFAFIGGVEHYHTERDDLEHLSPRSVQHQGQSVLALMRVLAAADLDELEGGDAAYTDVLGLVFLRWPAGASLPVVAALGLLVVTAGVRLRSRLGVSARSIAGGFVLGLVLLVGVPAVTHGVDRVIVSLAGHPTPWAAHPLPYRFALWTASLGSGVIVGGNFGRRVGMWGLACGGWILFAALGAIAVSLAPGTSPYFILPLGAAAAGLLLAPVGRGRQAEVIAVLLPLVATGAIVFPLAPAMEEAFGFSVPAAAVLPVAVVSVAWAPTLVSLPLVWSRRLVAAACVVLVSSAVAASLVEPHSAERPRRLNVLHHTDLEQDEAFIAVGPGRQPPPEAMRRLLAFADEPRQLLPWSPDWYWVARADPVEAPAPTVAVLEAGDTVAGRRVRARIVSQRRADRLIVLASPQTELISAMVEGQPLGSDDLPPRWRGRRGIIVFGLPPAGVELELEVTGSGPIELELIDLDTSMPATTRPVIEARGDRAVQSQWGDTSSMLRRVAL